LLEGGILVDNMQVLLKELPIPAAEKAAHPLPLDYPSPAILALANPTRIAGYDFARAVAIFGMLVDHCIQVLGPKVPTGWGNTLMTMLDGRPSAVFVVLSGVGVTLLGRRGDAAGLRRTLWRRGAVLLGIGFINQAIWPGDILRLFGVSLMAVAFLTTLSSRWLLAIAGGLVVAFPSLTWVLNYDAHWNWDTMGYSGMWDPVVAAKKVWRNGFDWSVLPTWGNVTAASMNILYNGFRPVVPWAGLLVLGMWLGRIDTTRAGVRRRMLVWGVALTGTVELISHAVMYFTRGHRLEEEIIIVMDTGSMPPYPPFVLSVAGVALTVIGLSLMIGVRFPQSRPVRAIVKTGQMALSCYIFHILIGAAFVWVYGRNQTATVNLGLLAGVTLFALLVWVSVMWKRRWRYGPMEALLRSVG
jgi:uncharacterized protein